MSRASETRRFLDGLSLMSRQQWLVRVVVLFAPAAAFLVEVRAGASVQTLPLVLLVLATGASLLLPDSHAPLGVLLVLGGYWALGVDEQLSVSLLVMTLLLVTFHVACLLASYGPPSVVLDRALVERWLLRGCAGVAAAGLVWAAAGVVSGLDPAGHGWLLAAALLLTLGAAGLLHRRLVLAPG